MIEANAAAAIAYRDLLKFLRDRTRIFGTLITPLIMVGALGGSLQASFGAQMDVNLLVFTFTGVYALTMFQTTAFGLISLLQDRETDFAQEMFVSPISRYTIIVGKIIGETLVALPQAVAIIAFAVIVRIEFSPPQLAGLLLTGIASALLGGAFGLLVLSNIDTQRAANQVFPFLILPQYFLAGIFNPLQGLPWILDVVSRLAPLRYAVDLVRGVFYAGDPEFPLVVLDPPIHNLAVGTAFFVVFIVVGTVLFVRRERNR
jgi:ABC-2 type transport system permease protein